MTEPGWPDDWADRMAGKGCPMCATLGKGDNDFAVEVFTGDVADVYLERRSRLPGYCIVIWKHGHVAEPADLPAEQASRYWAEVLATGRAVRTRFSPVKLNYFTLGNQVPHLHTHVLPRYRDDPAPGGPIGWQDIFSPDPVSDAELHAQAADLRALLTGGKRPLSMTRLLQWAANRAGCR
jgi:diadenosine tetraphosphate (Ap4A) HIT family hydrolase